MKRMLTINISPSGSLDTDAAANALLLHSNTPPPDMGVSPAKLLFGRHITDHMLKPICFKQEWSELADMREMAHARRKEESTRGNYRRELKPLSCGDTVCVQNQHRNHPLRWNATGTVVDCLPHRQYKVLIDGSRRITLRNRRFLRQTGDSTRNTFDDKPDLTAMPPIAIKETALRDYVIPDEEV